MSGLAKLIGGAIGAAIVWIYWQVRQRKAAARLAELDEGRRCVSCDGTDLAREGDVARCLRCGQTVSLASLRAAVVNASEIAAVTKPPEDRGTWR
jgi:hypothetical protein